MRKEELNTDKAFREKLENHSVEPPVHVWDGVQGELAGLRRKKRIAFFSRVAAAAVILLAFLAGWYFNEKSNEIIPESVQSEVTQQEPGDKGESGFSDEEQTEPQKIDSASSSKEMLANAEVRDNKENSTQTNKSTFTAENSNNNSDLQKENVVSVPRFSLTKLDAIENAKIAQEKETDWEETTIKQDFPAVNEFDRELIAANIRTDENVSITESGWKMGVNFSPGYASHTSNHTGEYARNMTYQTSEGNANVTGGISVQYKTGKRWSVESGVYYAQNGQKSGNSQNVFASSAERQGDFELASAAGDYYFNTAVKVAENQMAMNSTAGIIEFDHVPQGTVLAANPEESAAFSNTLLTNGEFNQVFEFVEIPLYLRYLLIDSRFDVELIGGVNAGVVVGNNAFMENEYGLQNVGKTQDISSVNMSGTLGIGMNYALGKRISLAVEPRVNYFLNSINKNPDVDYRPYRIGVHTGLYYEF